MEFFHQTEGWGRVYGFKCSISTHPAKYHRARDASRNQTMTQATSSFKKTAESVLRM